MGIKSPAEHCALSKTHMFVCGTHTENEVLALPLKVIGNTAGPAKSIVPANKHVRGNPIAKLQFVDGSLTEASPLFCKWSWQSPWQAGAEAMTISTSMAKLLRSHGSKIGNKGSAVEDLHSVHSG